MRLMVIILVLVGLVVVDQFKFRGYYGSQLSQAIARMGEASCLCSGVEDSELVPVHFSSFPVCRGRIQLIKSSAGAVLRWTELGVATL